MATSRAGGLWSLALGLGLLFGLNSSPARSQGEDGEKIYQRTLKGTVWILVKRPNGTARGTGSLIDKGKRLVITNYHVVGDQGQALVVFPQFNRGKPIAEQSHYVAVIQRGGGIQATVLHVDSRRDLAVLELERVPQSAQAIRLARDSATPAKAVHSIGNPGRSDLLWEYTSGTVRQVGQKRWRVRDENRVHNFEAKVVETQSPTNQGDSGGPLVNSSGELVGVTQGIATDAQLLSLFIDVSEVKTFLSSKRLLPRYTASTAGGAAEPTNKARAGSGLKTAIELEKEANNKLKLARMLADAGKLEKAKDRYEDIILSFPDTKAAAEAKLLLDKLKQP